MSTDRLSQLLHELDDLDVALPAPAPVRARGRALRRRRQAAAATGGLALAVAGVATAVALGGGSTQTLEQLPPAQQPTAPVVVSPAPTAEPSPAQPTGGAAPTTQPSSAPTTAPTTVPTTAPVGQPATPAPPGGPTAPAAEDGTSMAHLVEFRDEGSSTVLVVDRVQWLTGEQARAYAAAQGRELDTDWVIANDNPLLREHPVSPDVRVTLTVPLSEAMTADPVEVSLAELRRRLAAVSYAADIPFDVTVEDGAVVAIEQVYVP